MKKVLILSTISFILTNYTSYGQKPSYKSETLKIRQIGNNVFTHVSYLETDDFGKVACNGMIYFNENESIVFDTPTDNNASKELINWIEKKQKKKIRAVIVTHFHSDCLGGLKEFHKNGTKSYANNSTIELARKNKLNTLPENGFESKIEIQIGQETVFAQFFGQGHTTDNIVGYIPSEKALFGGCLIKSLNANKEYLGDANINEWSKTVQKIRNEISDLKIVIPGHGENGGTELLDYTIKLFKLIELPI